MSKKIPIFKYPGGTEVEPPIDGDNTIYKWIDSLGGAFYLEP